MARRQSISSKEVVGTEGEVRLPSGAVPEIEGVRYFDAPVDDGQTEGETGTSVTIVELETPSNLQVESQTIKFTPEGHQYVTVVVSFETEEAATGHEVRIAEA